MKRPVSLLKNSRVSDSTFASRRNLSGMKPPGTSSAKVFAARVLQPQIRRGGIAVLAARF